MPITALHGMQRGKNDHVEFNKRLRTSVRSETDTFASIDRFHLTEIG